MSSVAAPLVSPSVQIILEQLDELRVSKTEFARLLGVSPDYVYRILKGRVPFPHVRETMERLEGRLDAVLAVEGTMLGRLGHIAVGSRVQHRDAARCGDEHQQHQPPADAAEFV